MGAATKGHIDDGRVRRVLHDRPDAVGINHVDVQGGFGHTGQFCQRRPSEQLEHPDEVQCATGGGLFPVTAPSGQSSPGQSAARAALRSRKRAIGQDFGRLGRLFGD